MKDDEDQRVVTAEVPGFNQKSDVPQRAFGAGPVWSLGDLSALTHGSVIGNPKGYVRSDNVNAVIYRGLDNHIYELSQAPKSSWRVDDLSQIAHALVPAAGDPTPYVRSDNINVVVYRGSDGHIYELSQAPKSSWRVDDLSQIADAPPATGDPAGYVRSDHVNVVVYRGPDSHIHELSLSQGSPGV
jgi:hypothetical protein